MSKQRSPLLEEFSRLRAEGKKPRITDLWLRASKYDALEAYSKDMAVKHSTATFHIAREPLRDRDGRDRGNV
jgi:hypothetical protein